MSTDTFKPTELVSEEIIGDNLDLTESFVKSNLKNKRGMILLAYADFCGACKTFKPKFIEFMRKNENGDLLIKAIPVNEEKNMPLMAKIARWNKDNSLKYKIEFIPMVISFDEKGRFFSIYGNSGEYEEEKLSRKNELKDLVYRTSKDLEDYCKGVGNYSIDFKLIKDK